MTEFNKVLIQKYLSNQCTVEEVSFIENYIKQHPQALEDILSEQEWLSYVDKRKNYSFAFLKIAAMLLLCLSVAVMIYVYQNDSRPIASVQRATVQYIRQENISAKDLVLYIEDGSEITLVPGSAISYLKPLPKDKREFLLEGEGVFEVAKDKTRPFRVTAGGLTTTALGTKFRVTAYHSADETAVKLLEGKIKVSPVDAHVPGKKEYFLNAGDEISFNRKSYAVRQSIHRDSVVEYAEKIPKKTKAEEPAIRRSEVTDSHIWFNNERLEDVLGLLNTELNANIQYNKKEIRKMYYSGEFARLVSAEGVSNDPSIVKEILSTIASLNQLKLETVEGGYILSKSNN